MTKYVPSKRGSVVFWSCLIGRTGNISLSHHILASCFRRFPEWSDPEVSGSHDTSTEERLFPPAAYGSLSKQSVIPTTFPPARDN